MVPTKAIPTVQVAPLCQDQQHPVRVLGHHPGHRTSGGIAHGIRSIPRVLFAFSAPGEHLAKHRVAGIEGVSLVEEGAGHPHGEQFMGLLQEVSLQVGHPLQEIRMPHHSGGIGRCRVIPSGPARKG